MPPNQAIHTKVRATRRAGTLATVLAFGPLLGLLVLLTGYFALRDPPDWVHVVAFALAAAAVAARLAGALRPGRSE